MATTPLVARTSTPPAQMPSLPEPLRRALANPFAFGDHPDMPAWDLSTVGNLPPEAMIRQGIAILEAQTAAPDDEFMTKTIALMVAGKPRYGQMSAEMAELRAKVFKQVNGDLAQDLWVEAYFAVMRAPNIKRFPDPGEFRAFVERKHSDRWQDLKRCRAMLKAIVDKKPKPPPPKPKYNPTREAICRSCIALYVRKGDPAKAQPYEDELAQIEGRKRRKLAKERVVEPPPRPTVERPAVPIAESPSVKAGLLRARARFWRDQGKTEFADKLTEQATALLSTDAGGPPAAAPASAGEHEHLR